MDYRLKLIKAHITDLDKAINEELSGREYRIARALRWVIILVNSVQILVLDRSDEHTATNDFGRNTEWGGQ